MSLKDILKGHFNELIGREEDLFIERINICKNCPLYTVVPGVGPMCDKKKYYNPNTEELTNFETINSINGCGCRLDAKLRVPNAVCVLDKF